MIDISLVEQIVTEKLTEGDMFLVEVKLLPGNQIEVIVDSDTSVAIDNCVELSKLIESQFDREKEDFELTVASAGIGQPLKILRQYLKLIDKSVEIVLASGIKFEAILKDATQDEITVCCQEMVVVEGKKKKQPVEVVKTIPLSQIKSTKEVLDYK